MGRDVRRVVPARDPEHLTTTPRAAADDCTRVIRHEGRHNIVPPPQLQYCLLLSVVWL